MGRQLLGDGLGGLVFPVMLTASEFWGEGYLNWFSDYVNLRVGSDVVGGIEGR